MFSNTTGVEQRILKEILSGTYREGSKIPSQNQLIRKYGVSRTTLLRALRKLTDDGYLRGQRGSGTYVCSARKREAPLQISAIGMRGTYYPFGQVLSEVEPVRWYTEKEAFGHLEELASPGSTVIWILPHPSSMLMMEYLRSHGTRQLLINRSYGDYDCICSDSGTAMLEGMKRLCPDSRQAPALITHEPSELRPYLTNYVISYYEACARMKLLPEPEYNFSMRFSPDREEFSEIGRRLFAGKDPIRRIVVLNFELVLPTLMSAIRYDLRCGKDFQLLTFDISPEWHEVSGITAMCHDYQAYRREIGCWLKSLNRPGTARYEVKLPCRILEPPFDFAALT